MPDTPRPIDRLLDIMARLRDPESGCPWDVEQSFATIAPYTIEEAYEVAEAIAARDMAALEDELGDLLLQVVFHAQMAREAGLFDFDAVSTAIGDKMVRRHPHVFGPKDAPGARVGSAEAQTAAWEEHKAAERRHRRSGEAEEAPASVLDGVPRALPALTRAFKLGKRAARNGFDWPTADRVIDKIEEEIGELRAEIAEGGPRHRLEEELGDLLFACANLARHLGADPEAAVRRANRKFERRFRRLEALLAAQGRGPKGAPLDDLEALWQQAKAEETDPTRVNQPGKAEE